MCGLSMEGYGDYYSSQCGLLFANYFLTPRLKILLNIPFFFVGLTLMSETIISIVWYKIFYDHLNSLQVGALY